MAGQVRQDFRSEPRVEIAGSDRGFYRQLLKHEREMLDAIFAKLGAAQ
jgi:hypothetical protein